MNVAEAITKRRSIRSYESKVVEPEKINTILEAARWSPLAHNQPNWHIVLVRNVEMIKKITRACEDEDFIAETNALLCFCATNTEFALTNGEMSHTMNISSAISFAMLQATELELASCWIGGFNEAKIKALLRIPDTVRLVSMLCVGYPHFTPPAPARLPLTELVSVENYPQPFEAL